MRILFLILGLLSVGLAIFGVVLPLIPTVPFLLLAAFFFAKSSDRLHTWIVSHKTFGPMIQDWQSNGSIRLPAKRAATVSVAAVFIISIGVQAPTYILVIQGFVLSFVMIFIWSRPSG